MCSKIKRKVRNGVRYYNIFGFRAFMARSFLELEILMRIKQREKIAKSSKSKIALDLDYQYKITHIEELKKNISEYRANKKRNRIAVFTAISNNYDSLKIPSFINNNYDYICFTNTDIEDTGIWEIRPCLYLSSNPTRITRYVKTHAHYLLSEYDLAIWMDSNIVIKGDITGEINAFVSSGLPVATFHHPVRNNVYDEADVIIKYKIDDPVIVMKQIARMREQGFEHHDLVESNLMLFNLKHDKTAEFLNTWWNEIDTYSKRDQLSFNFALYKNGTNFYPVAEKFICARNHDKFIYCSHDHNSSTNNIVLRSISKYKINPYYGIPFSQVKNDRLDRTKEKSIDVIICVHNESEHFKECIGSVIASRKFNSYNIIVVDGGSDKETAGYVKSLPSLYPFISVVRNEEKLGRAKAINKGMELSEAGFVIVLDSDTIVSEGWAEKMVSALNNTPGAGMVGVLSNVTLYQSAPSKDIDRDGKEIINELPGNFSVEEVNNLCEEWTTDGHFPKVPLICGNCFGISRAVIDKAGYFDDVSSEKGYGVEYDYCLKVREKGFDLIVATNTFVFQTKNNSYDFPVGKNQAPVDSDFAVLCDKHGREKCDRALKDLQGNLILQEFRRKAEATFNQIGTGE